MNPTDQAKFNPVQQPLLNEKVLRDKRKKLRETFERIVRLYERENPDTYKELRKLELDYESNRGKLSLYFDSVKNAELVEVDSIPLPEMPHAPSSILIQDIPLPGAQPPSILKKGSSTVSVSFLWTIPQPYQLLCKHSLFLSQMITQIWRFTQGCVICFAGRSVRFADMPPSAPREKSKKKRIVKKKKAITPLQAMMLRMAGTVSPSVCAPPFLRPPGMLGGPRGPMPRLLPPGPPPGRPPGPPPGPPPGLPPGPPPRGPPPRLPPPAPPGMCGCIFVPFIGISRLYPFSLNTEHCQNIHIF
uniref:WW domain-binding protein 11 n=1 Tax=Oncorhynchus kisutch TaxID=8019 RepID=A0A8C7F023_ONCKI